MIYSAYVKYTTIQVDSRQSMVKTWERMRAAGRIFALNRESGERESSTATIRGGGVYLRKYLVLVLVMVLIISAGCSSSDPEEPAGSTPDTLPDGTAVTFTCPELERIVREQVGKMEGDLLSEDLQYLSSLRIWEVDVSSFDGLEYAVNLDSVSIGHSMVPELGSLGDLPNLTYLNISYSEVTEPLVFQYPKSLTRVSFIDTQLQDLDFMKGMVNLESLTLSRVGISDITPLQSMAKLQTLRMDDNAIVDLEPLRGKPDLVSLNLQGNEVMDIGPLADLTALEELVLSYNPVTNLQPLENLNGLKELVIYKDHDVKHLILDQVRLLEQKGIQVQYHE